MINIIFKEILNTITVILGVYCILFFIFEMVASAKVESIIGQNADEYTKKNISKQFHFDKSTKVRFFISLNNLSPISIYSKDRESIYYNEEERLKFIYLFNIGKNFIILKMPYFGISFQSLEKVDTIIYPKFIATLILSIFSIIISSILGVVLGILSANYYNTWIDKFLGIISGIGVAIPSYFASMLIAIIFGFYLHYITGLEFNGSFIDYNDQGEKFYNFKNLILPIFSLSLRPISIIYQVTRTTILEILTEDYIRTSKAKGLSNNVILYKHALKNAIIPITISISGWLASMLGGTYFIEMIYDYKGLGNLTITSLLHYDYPIVIASTIYISIIFLAINSLVNVFILKK